MRYIHEEKSRQIRDFGGQYVPETVMNAVHELEQAYDFIKITHSFKKN